MYPRPSSSSLGKWGHGSEQAPTGMSLSSTLPYWKGTVLHETGTPGASYQPPLVSKVTQKHVSQHLKGSNGKGRRGCTCMLVWDRIVAFAHATLFVLLSGVHQPPCTYLSQMT